MREIKQVVETVEMKTQIGEIIHINNMLILLHYQNEQSKFVPLYFRFESIV